MTDQAVHASEFCVRKGSSKKVEPLFLRAFLSKKRQTLGTVRYFPMLQLIDA